MKTQMTVSELASCLDQPNIKLIDGSWALDGTDMHLKYQSEHIPGALFFDLELISDHNVDLPHMAPKPDYFAACVGEMGINENDTVIVYDQFGLFSAPRIWWTFKVMGHKNVFVLSGGLPAWKDAGMPITSQNELKEKMNYAPKFNNNLVIDISELKSLVKAEAIKIIDARPELRFWGEVPEPRDGLRRGHMPLSVSLPYSRLISNGAFRQKSELMSIFEGIDIKPNEAVITTCGSGVTAAILSMALEECDYSSHRLYDGSWAQWGRYDMNTEVI